MNDETRQPDSPHSLEAEEVVLATMMHHPESLYEVRGMLRPESFYSLDHEEIWRAIVALEEQGKPCIGELVREQLVCRGTYRNIGGHETLTRLLAAMSSPTAVRHFAARVREHSRVRELMRLATALTRRCQAHTNLLNPSELIAKWIEGELKRIFEAGCTDSSVTLGEVAYEVLESKQNGETDRIETGLVDLDELTGGFPIGRMTIVGGKAGMGKSQLLKWCGLSFASGGIPFSLISIEEGRRKIAENTLAAVSGIENHKINRNNLGPGELGQIAGAAQSLATLPYRIEDAYNRLSDIEQAIRRQVKRHGAQVVALDHLHLVDAEIDGNREQEVTKISRRVKLLAKELNVVMIVACQLNRGSGAADRETLPELENLRNSGTLEQDGDLILMLHRQDYFEWKKQGDNFQPDHRLRVFANKNKDGPPGSCDLYFDGALQTVRDWPGNFIESI